MSTPGSDRLSDAALALLARRAGINPDSAPRRGAGGESALLASPQLGQWFSGEVSGSGVVGALPKILHLEGPLDRKALRRALTEIVRRHQVLRTVFRVEGGEPMQRVRPAREAELREVDLRGIPTADRPEAARRVLDQDARRPFDLTQDQLMRPLLVQLSDQDFELQVTFQQVAFDGWSTGIYLRELGELYSAYAAGRDSPLAELPLQYADFAIWERTREATPAFREDRAYWTAQVAGSTTALELPTDLPRPRPRTHSRATATAILEAPLTRRLSQVALEDGVTLFAVTFAAFQVLVGRRAGRNDFVLGVVSANRAHRETEGLIGSFVTVVPVRTRLDAGPSFRAHLRRSADSLVQGFAHRAYPFQRLMADLRPGGSPGANPLYDVVFNYRNMPVSLPVMDGLAVSDFRAPHLSTTHDLHLSVTPEGGRLALDLDYNPDLFQAGTVTRWLEGYRVLLEAVSANPDSSSAVLPVMPAGERRLLLEQWSGASVPVPALHFVMDRFEQAAAAAPDAPAIEQAGAALRYGELRGRVRILAAGLRHAGVARGDLVGLLADRSIDTISAMLAILSIGGVYVPLDPRTPLRRIDAMLATANLKLVLTDRSGAPALAGRPEPTLEIADLLAGNDPPGVSGDPEPVGEQDAAYVIFTSGSTGHPKGVVVPHGALGRYMTAAIVALDARPGDRQVQSGALTFDVSIREILVPLGTRGTLVLRPERMFDSPAALVEESRALRLTHVWMPTAFWAELTRSEVPGGLNLGAAVRIVSFGGEAATPDALRRFRLAIPRGVRYFNGYGPTETTIACTRAELTEYENDVAVPIGRPVPGATAYVLDPHHQPVPIGVPGELWIGGCNLASGYLNAPELTAQRFVPDHFSSAPGARLYKTGDMVRWLPDGQLTFMGRNDLQVKVRGYRIELPDVERVLRDVAGVSEAVVIVHEGDRLVGFVTAADPGLLSGSAIREAAALELPHYMVPSQIVALERLPLGITGKVDRDRLRAMVPAFGGAPSTRTEAVVAKVWEAVLGIAGVGPEDRFLDLGGHSILAIRVANRLRDEIGIHVTIRTLLGHPTVAALAQELDRLAADAVPPTE